MSVNLKVPLEQSHRRIITGFSCERGTVEDVKDMLAIKKRMDSGLGENPNLVEEMARKAFMPVKVEPAIPSSILKRKKIEKRREERKSIRIGIPRVLNMYNLAPFFMGYFQSLGMDSANIVFSPMTNEKLYKEGAKRGSIDPCFPSKLCIPHVHYLLELHKRAPMHALFFPMIYAFPTFLKNIKASTSCPTVCATPEAVKAAFTKEKDIFQEVGIKFLNPMLNMENLPLVARQMEQSFGEILKLDSDENKLAIEQGARALRDYEAHFRARGKEVIEQLEKEKKIGFVVLARPYHNDEGVNHEIFVKIQRLGYPLIPQDALPIDEGTLSSVFNDDAGKAGRHPLSISDVWITSYSENTNRKIWSAKFVARHPNLVALEISNFKCGHDAPVYAVIEKILSSSETPFFTFRDLDENNPGGAIKIRLETMDYFLKREAEKLKGKLESLPAPA